MFQTKQIVAIIVAVVIAAVLLFSFDISKPGLENTSIVESEFSISDETVLKKAYEKLSSQDQVTRSLRIQLDSQNEDDFDVEIAKKLSSRWYQAGDLSVSGYYARLVAEKENSAGAWGIAGATYFAGLKNAKEDKTKTYCLEQAIRCFQSAISLDSENIDYRTNLALCHVESPPKENPMKGIMMLIDLNKTNPNDVGVLFQLARLGVQTGQYEKAFGRLNKILSIDSKHKKSHCLMLVVKEALKKENIEEHQRFCQ